jgi:transposase
MKAVPFAAREARRLQAWKFHQLGWSQRAIAELLEVSAAAVSQWCKRARLAGGVRGLRRRKAAGAARRLPRARRRELRALLRRGAEAHGFHGALWTRRRVALLIEREFGVRYSPRHVGRLLAEMNWSVQRPLRRARQRNAAKIARWRTKRWPALQAKPSA